MPSDTSRGVALRICVWISACSVWTPCLAEPESACQLSSGKPDEIWGAWLGEIPRHARNRRPTDKSCRRIMIPEKGNKDCPGIDTDSKVRGTGGTERYAELEVRAVKYVPRPVGVVGHVDLYDDHFHFIHKRDLYIISQILKANTIRIDPWLNDNEHKGFFALCKEFGLMVIPTFDMSYFFRTQEWREASFSHLRETALRHFDKFMKNVRFDEPVLMWSINHGLFLNETTENGFLSRDATNPHRDRYFELLKAFRNVHYEYEWDKGLVKNAYARPLALPLLLDSKKSQDNVGWFLAFAENDWTRWPPTTPEGLGKDGETALKEAGVFDVWLVETMPPTQHENIKDVVESLVLFNDSVLSEIPAKHPGKQPGSKQYPDCNGGEPFCNYATKKAVLLQYGFSALTENPSKQMRLELDIDRQQDYLLKVWSVVRDKEIDGNVKLSDLMKMSCVRGAVIDEWADDWDRCATMGYDSQAFIQNKGGMCDEVKPGKLVHVEWFGLSAQYSFFGHHCIDPRFRSDDNLAAMFRFAKWDTAPSAQDAIIAKEKEHWQNVAACALMIPDLRILIQIVVLTALIIFISFFRIRKLRLNQGFELEEPVTDQHQAGGRGSVGPMARTCICKHYFLHLIMTMNIMMPDR